MQASGLALDRRLCPTSGQRFRSLPPGPPDFEADRDERQGDDGGDDGQDVVVDVRHGLAEEETGDGDPDGPHEGADQVGHVKTRASMSVTPTSGFIRVRITGTNRARITAFAGPYFSR